MNIALIMAGGMGLRMFQNIPKQFLTVLDKPIMVYTLEAFQQHSEIDGIIVPCLDGYQEILRAYAQQYNITKLRWIVDGGESGQASIRNGVYELRDVCNAEDIVVIHDAIRPMISQEIISSSISSCRKYGSGLASLQCAETFFYTKDGGVSGVESIDRSELIRVQTPQSYRYDKLLSAHEEAINLGIEDASSTSTIMSALGEPVYFSAGSEKNFKITTYEDLEVMKAYYLAKQKGMVN